jgi:hypothetical protein
VAAWRESPVLTPVRWWWGFALDGAGVVPLLLFGRKLRWAWVAHFGCMTLWIIYALDSGQPSFLPGALGYASFDVWGWWRWRPALDQGARP